MVEESTRVSQRAIKRILGSRKSTSAGNFIQYTLKDTHKVMKRDSHKRFSVSMSFSAQVMNFVCKKKMPITISTVLLKLSDRTDFKNSSTSEDRLKEFGFLLKRQQGGPDRKALCKVFSSNCSPCGMPQLFHSNALVIFSCDYYD